MEGINGNHMEQTSQLSKTGAALTGTGVNWTRRVACPGSLLRLPDAIPGMQQALPGRLP
jgi:hypothetical protein